MKDEVPSVLANMALLDLKVNRVCFPQLTAAGTHGSFANSCLETSRASGSSVSKVPNHIFPSYNLPINI